MNIEIIRGVLIPFLGTVLGSACVFFLRKNIGDLVQRALTGFAAGVMVAASIWSLLIPGHGTVGGNGKMVICPRSSRVLGRHFVFTFAGSCDPASAYEE